MPPHIKSPVDLVTKTSEIRSGFLSQAIQKAKIAAKFIVRAKQFREALAGVKRTDELSDLTDFKPELIAAAGISKKGSRYLTDEDLEDIVEKSLEVASAEEDFRQELVERYLLTQGDALGGGMRNWIGSHGNERLVAHLVAAINERKIPFEQIYNANQTKVKAIKWANRYLVFDHKPRLINKNIDAILIDTSGVTSFNDTVYAEPERYLAAGELKGGIDPAGADEHWKTANSALGRIREVFAREPKPPKLFFVGASIVSSMSEEIYKQLQDGRLVYAANLTSEEQMSDLARWLIDL